MGHMGWPSINCAFQGIGNAHNYFSAYRNSDVAKVASAAYRTTCAQHVVLRMQRQDLSAKLGWTGPGTSWRFWNGHGYEATGGS